MLLIDTFNVLHVTGILPPDLAGLEVDELAGLIRASRYANQPFRLVCDGSPSPRVRDSAALFSGPSQSADDLIEYLGRADHGRRRITIISSDRRLRTFAERQRSASMTSEHFLEQLSADHRGPRRKISPPLPALVSAVPLDWSSLTYWMNEFGLGEPVRQPTPAKPPPKHVRHHITSKPPDSPAVESQDPQRRSPKATSKPKTDAPKDPLAAITDPILREAIQRGIKFGSDPLTLDDLNMERWLPTSDTRLPSTKRPARDSSR